MTIDFPTISLKTVLHAVQQIMRALPTPDTIITISSAIEIAGYAPSSHNLEFLRSAKQYGLIEYNLQKDAFRLSLFMIRNFHITLCPTHSTIRAAALSPDIFSELFEYFKGELLIPPAAILRALSGHDIPESRKKTLAVAFSGTMRYLYDNMPQKFPHQQSIYSPDGLVLLQFPSNMTRQQLRKTFFTMLKSNPIKKSGRTSKNPSCSNKRQPTHSNTY